MTRVLLNKSQSCLPQTAQLILCAADIKVILGLQPKEPIII